MRILDKEAADRLYRTTATDMGLVSVFQRRLDTTQVWRKSLKRDKRGKLDSKRDISALRRLLRSVPWTMIARTGRSTSEKRRNLMARMISNKECRSYQM